jgi:hypothetical protein
MIQDEIRTLLAAPASGSGAPSLASIEHTLTSGYAEALALEAERSRIERRIGEIGAFLQARDDSAHESELTGLSRDLARTQSDLARLRALLARLRERAADARAA